MNRVVFSHFWIMSFYQAFFTIVWRWNTEKFCERKWLIAIETGKEIKLMNFDVSPWIDNICDVWVLEFIFYFFFSLWYAHNFYDISNIQMCSLRRHTAFQYQSPSIQIDLNGNFLSFFFLFEQVWIDAFVLIFANGVRWNPNYCQNEMKWNEKHFTLFHCFAVMRFYYCHILREWIFVDSISRIMFESGCLDLALALCMDCKLYKLH